MPVRRRRWGRGQWPLLQARSDQRIAVAKSMHCRSGPKAAKRSGSRQAANSVIRIHGRASGRAPTGTFRSTHCGGAGGVAASGRSYRHVPINALRWQNRCIVGAAPRPRSEAAAARLPIAVRSIDTRSPAGAGSYNFPGAFMVARRDALPQTAAAITSTAERIPWARPNPLRRRTSPFPSRGTCVRRALSVTGGIR